MRTTTRKTSGGNEVKYYYLAHNHRDPKTGAVSAQIIHSFGRADRLDRDELVRLCKSIARVCGVEVTDVLGKEDALKASAARAGVLPVGMRRVETRPLGVAWVAAHLWKRLGVEAALKKAARRERARPEYERALLAMVTNRLDEPTSKLGVWERWLETVHMPQCAGLQLNDMYKAMDFLHAHATKVEEEVFFRTAELLDLEVDLVFYDTTTCSFSIDYEDQSSEDAEEEALRRFGKAKEGGWSPQVVVALAVTRQGLPVRSWVFPGNTSDATTVAKVKADLKGWKLGRALFVADAGMNSEANRAELLKACGRYLLAARAGSVKEIKEEVLTRAGRYKKLSDSLEAKEVLVGEGELRRRYILCRNLSQARREAEHRKVVLEELRAKLKKHPDRSADQKWAVKLRASGRYGRYVKVNDNDKLVIDRAAVARARRLDGKWVLITNDDTLDVEHAANGYRSLLIIERCFRALKRTQIRMTPMYHWLPRRIEAHVKICVLALLLSRVAELATGKSWPMLRHELRRLQVTEYETDSHRFFERNSVPAKVARILKKLKISSPKPVLDVLPTP